MTLAELRRKYVKGTTFQVGNPGWFAIHLAGVIGLICLGMALTCKKEEDGSA